MTGYEKLLKAVEKDEKESPNFHDYRAKLKWVVDRADSYAKATGLNATDILNRWEEKRNYWYMNFYQECNQPELKGDNVRVFENLGGFHKSIGLTKGFRCPMCKGISKSPYSCDSGEDMESGKTCDWKVYGLFGDLGKGCFVFIKERMIGERIFMPIAWEG